MDFAHSDDRQMLANSLSRYLNDRYPFDTRLAIAGSPEGWSASQWQALADLGVTGALFSPDVGGFGGSGFDIAVVFELLGRALAVEPFLGTAMAGRTLTIAGGQQALIDAMIAGEAKLAFAHEEPRSRHVLTSIEASATRHGSGWILNGRKSVVPQLEAADHILVSSRRDGAAQGTDGISLFLVDAAATGLSVRGYPLIDGGRGGELSLADTPAILIAEDGYPIIEEAVAAGIVALCWEAVGILETLRDATVDYLRTRRQFGVPIGKFQALQHRLATVEIEIAQARSSAINAAGALDGDRHGRERSASAAKFTIGRVGTLVAEEAIQMHGGIGMTWELPLSHYAKRLIMLGHQLGDEDHHLARFAGLRCAE